MDWNRVEGNWKQFKGQIKEKWGNLTDDDLDRVAGQRDQLEGVIQERYGIAKDQVRKDIDTRLDTQRL
ncbi:MAG: CsbD family protein [Pseudolabrys sp.]|jgi:uncharacterized protein YjbJ (UPF0337 family)